MDETAANTLLNDETGDDMADSSMSRILIVTADAETSDQQRQPDPATGKRERSISCEGVVGDRH